MYKYFGRGDTAHKSITTPSSQLQGNQPINPEENKLKYELTLNARDPFLDKVYRNKLVKQQNASRPRPSINTAHRVVPKLWPDINYLGLY